MKAVDYVVDANDCIYFIEVKNFQHPDAPLENRQKDYKMLVEAGTAIKSIFALEMGEKIKDSLLRKYSIGSEFTKNVIYLLVVHLGALTARERGRLREKISGHVPTGLNKPQFSKFTELSFNLVDVEQLEQYGIECMEL
jgi:hypothetical protein